MDLDEAEIFIKRLAAAESQEYTIKYPPQMDGLLLSGKLQMRRRNLEDAMLLFKECKELHADLDKISYIGAAFSLAGSAEVLLLQGNVEEATRNIYDAESIEKLTGGSRSLAICIKWNFARLFSRMEDSVRAISRYHELIEEHQSHYGPGYQRWNALHCELGNAYQNLGDMQKAEYYYRIGCWADSSDIPQWLVYGSLTKT
ncbi:NB-ARC domain-containing protein [Aspergillus sp. HF37]|nr:NB-ARC domain-containing protein [Aspergillus sp. HF37]